MDSWGQPCASTDRKGKLHIECDAFTGGPYLSGVEQGQASFGPIKIKVRIREIVFLSTPMIANSKGHRFASFPLSLLIFPYQQKSYLPVYSLCFVPMLQVVSDQSPCTKKVKISLVTVDLFRRKQVISETIKELNHFTIKVLPSGLPHRIQICHGSPETNGDVMNGSTRSRDSRRDCLELSAPAGSVLKGLYLKAYDESGMCLSDNDLRKAHPTVMTSWNGEVCRMCNYTVTVMGPIRVQRFDWIRYIMPV